MAKYQDITLRQYAHGLTVAAVAEHELKAMPGAELRAQVADVDIFEALAHLFNEKVKQTQRIESLRVIEFEHGGVTYFCGVPQC